MTNLNILPKRDFSRSYAALRVKEMAEANRSSFFHFEARKQLELPSEWLGEERPVYHWHKGLMGESKYSAFRNDHLLASFQPAHTSKWTTHEIMHNLLGFAWAPGSSIFFHSLASRLSESLPVALYYFFDELGLKRCEKHRYSASFHGERCYECEAVAGDDLVEDFDTKNIMWQMGEEFLDREIQAVKKSMKTGYVYENIFSGLNLTTDSMYYAANQISRLNDPLFERYIDEFYRPLGLVHEDLDSLISRIELILGDLKSKSPVTYDLNNIDQETHSRMDLAYRILVMAKHVEGTEVYDPLCEIVFNQLKSEGELQSAMEAYESLCEAYELIPPHDMFSVGYELNDKYGFSTGQLEDGLLSQFPHSISIWKANDPKSFNESIHEFSRKMPWERDSIGKRFLDSMRPSIPESLISFFEKEYLIEWNRPSKPEYYYLGSQSKELRWNPAMRLLSTEADGWQDLGLSFGTSFDELSVLSLKTHKNENSQIFPLSKVEFEEIDSAIKENREPAVESSIISDLKRELFLVNAKWEL